MSEHDPFSGQDESGSREVWFTLAYPDEIDLLVPPVLFAVPARHAGPLQNPDRVTIGRPGLWWLIDQMVVVAGPTGHGDTESYAVAPVSDWAASWARPEECEGLRPTQCRPVEIEIATADMWVYRPAPAATDVRDLPARVPLDNTQTDLTTPPLVRRPRPARELPALTGRAVTVPGPGPSVWWTSAVAVSEPVSEDGDLVVHVVTAYEHYRAGYGQLRDDAVRAVPLHHVWVF